MININEYNKQKIGLAIRADWNKFIRDVCGVHLDRDQQAIVSSVQFEPRTSVSSGTARGKDFAAAWACFCFFAFTPEFRRDQFDKIYLYGNTKVAMTAPTDRQIKNIMFPEITKIFRKVQERAPEISYPTSMRLVGYDIRTKWEEWFLTGFKADNNNIEAWSGFHASNVMFAVTEASGIDEKIWQSIEGNLQGNSRLLIVFNPNTPNGYAAKSMKQSGWNKFNLNSLESPNVVAKKIVIPGQVDYLWVKNMVETQCTIIQENEYIAEKNDFKFEGQWYRPNDFFRVKVLGEFPEESEGMLIPLKWIELANGRWERRDERNLVNAKIGVDVAGMGRDSSVIAKRYNDYLAPFIKHQSGGKADHMRIAGMVFQELKKEGSIAFIDTIGEGAGVYSRLEEQGLNDKAISCKFSESAEGLKDQTGQLEFANMKSYLYWCVREWLDPKNETGASLPPNDTFKEQASEIKWEFMSNGKIKIEKKEDYIKRTGYSPDEFDALANTFYPVKNYSKVSLSVIAGMY